MIAPLLLASLSTAAPAAPAARHEIQFPSRDTLAQPRRAHHALAYDEAGGRVLLTGGCTPVDGGQRFEFLNDLWVFDGARWTQLPSSGAKSSGRRLAWDRKRSLMVSFGGFDGRSLPDLRVLERDTWRTIGQHIEMPAAEPGFIYDSRRNRFVAFGGSAALGQPHGNTWELDGESWKRVATVSPPARQAHAMVYDERRGRTVVFGGMGPGEPGRPPPALGDTWEFDGKSWTERRVTGPGARWPDGDLNDTWEWDGAAWRHVGR